MPNCPTGKISYRASLDSSLIPYILTTPTSLSSNTHSAHFRLPLQFSSVAFPFVLAFLLPFLAFNSLVWEGP